MAAQKLNSDPIGEDGKAGKFVFLTPVNISSHKFLRTHLFCEGTTSKRICAFSFKLILVHCFPIYLRAFWRRFGPYCFLGLLCTIIIPKYFLFLQYFISSRKGLHLNRHSAASSSCVEVLKGGLNVMMLVFTTVRCLFNLHHIMERGFTTSDSAAKKEGNGNLVYFINLC